MPAIPVTLQQIRKDQAADYSELGGRIIRKGIPDLTTTEVVRYEELNQLRITGQFAQGASDDSLRKAEARRIETMRENMRRNEPPFKPSTLLWVWDAKRKEFHWGSPKIFPKDLMGDTSQFVFQPEYSSGENPYAKYLQEETLPVR